MPRVLSRFQFIPWPYASYYDQTAFLNISSIAQNTSCHYLHCLIPTVDVINIQISGKCWFPIFVFLSISLHLNNKPIFMSPFITFKLLINNKINQCIYHKFWNFKKFSNYMLLTFSCWTIYINASSKSCIKYPNQRNYSQSSSFYVIAKPLLYNHFFILIC